MHMFLIKMNAIIIKVIINEYQRYNNEKRTNYNFLLTLQNI